eukprot:TRINITY_DN70492_c0_g1_i1.p1 TRINITY_DN70492_c0_g1~~TRINITY_DN70492_c0_g1_i1.p1  ORF type:complete len:196 (+),score=53.49 TRINITY_DN70492_c0_g1_i1:56-643(+)
MSGESYSLWLSPSGPELEKLQLLVDWCADEFNTDTFVPHVTLLGGIPYDGSDEQTKEILAKCWQLACALEPFEIRFQELASFQPWNQSLLAVTDRPPALLEANKLAQRLHRPGADAEPAAFFPPPVEEPHLSIAYMDGAPEEERQKALSKVKEKHEWLTSFKFTAFNLSLWKTSQGFQGVKSHWKKLADFPLQKR